VLINLDMFYLLFIFLYSFRCIRYRLVNKVDQKERAGRSLGIKGNQRQIYRIAKQMAKEKQDNWFCIYPRDVVSAVYATATWLAGWLAGCLSHAGIVSKRLNLS